jgi:transposase
MLTITAQKIYIYRAPVNLHKSFEGLSGLVESSFPGRLLSGSLFVFLNRQKTKLKLLYWDNDGLAIWYKRLERGTFSINKDFKTELTRREFFMLLEGIKPRRLNKRFSL